MPARPAPRRFAAFLVVVETAIALGHLELWFSARFFFGAGRVTGWCLAGLAASFVAASLLAFRTYAPPARWFYRAAAVWLAAALYLDGAAAAAWLVFAVAGHREVVAWAATAAAAAVTLYGVWHGARLQVRHVEVALAGLPAAWSGRRIALVSDTHLGHVRGAGLVRRIVRRVNELAPSLVLLAGDIFDGTPAPYAELAAPWAGLRAPAYYVAGNHEGFTPRPGYLEALRAARVLVLQGECVDLEGLQLLGIGYGDAARAPRLAQLLQQARLDRSRASILLTHAPDPAPLAEAAGISLQVNGHTHGGQFWPFTHAVRRVYGNLAYGLSRLGGMQIFTTYGAGTWGPPLRVATDAELVILTLVGRGE